MVNKNNTDIDFLSYLEDEIIQWKQTHNFDPDLLDNLVGQLIYSVIKEWGGKKICVKQSGYLSKRDMKIFKEYDHEPETIKRLAKKYRVSERWVINIISVGKDGSKTG